MIAAATILRMRSASFGNQSIAIENIETSFQQDLNGDGTIGPPPPPPPTAIEGFGATDLVQVGNNYFLYPHGGSSGPSLKSSGAPVTAGTQFGAFAPIGAEQTASGYEVAWKVAGADQYTVWNTDSSGNYQILECEWVLWRGLAIRWISIEPSFQQDLNGDGTIGVRGVGARDRGAGQQRDHPRRGHDAEQQRGHRLRQRDAGRGGRAAHIHGAQRRHRHTDDLRTYAAFRGSAWWRDCRLRLWRGLPTPSRCNSTRQARGPGAVRSASPTTTATRTRSTSITGTVNTRQSGTVIEAFGVTHLVPVSNNFFLPHDGWSGPALKSSGAPVTAGQFGAFSPIGAGGERQADTRLLGVVAGADQYTVWNTDSSGNYIAKCDRRCSQEPAIR